MPGVIAARAVATRGAGARRARPFAEALLPRLARVGCGRCVVCARDAARPQRGGRQWDHGPHRSGRVRALSDEGAAHRHPRAAGALGQGRDRGRGQDRGQGWG